jgi:hypothetical protein
MLWFNQRIKVVLRPPVVCLEGITINYDLTPQKASNLLLHNDMSIASWPQDKMKYWNGGKTGTVNNATFPLLRLESKFDTTRGRSMQRDAQINFAWPVEIASLALPQNSPRRVMHELRNIGIDTIVALRQSGEELCILPIGNGWHVEAKPHCFCLNIKCVCHEHANCNGFARFPASCTWTPDTLLAGAIQVK